jgi:hypothetical protein
LPLVAGNTFFLKKKVIFVMIAVFGIKYISLMHNTAYTISYSIHSHVYVHMYVQI